MSTSYATKSNAAPRVPLGRSSPLSLASHHKLQVVTSAMSAMPKPIFNLQILLNKFIAGKSRREYLTSEPIYSQGDQANAVFYIQSGKIKLTVVSMNGKEVVIAHLDAGSFFGETCMAGELIRVSSAYALQSSAIVRIEKEVMQNLLHSEPQFAEHFLTHLLSRNNRMQADLVDHLFNSSEKRLARLLMLMANYGQESKPTPTIAKISQETLAEMIGTTRSRVSFFLNRFRDLGYIDYNCGGMLINDSLVNILLHD